MENIYDKESLKKLNSLIDFINSHDFNTVSKRHNIPKDYLKEILEEKLGNKGGIISKLELSDINNLSGGIESATIFLNNIIQHANNIKTILEYNKRQEFIKKELEDKNLKTLGKKLKYTRERANLSQKDFASILDVVPSLVSQIESDVNRPSYSLMIRIAKEFNIDLNWLLLEDEDYTQYLKSTFNQSFISTKLISNLKYECLELLEKVKQLEEESHALRLENNKLKKENLKKI